MGVLLSLMGIGQSGNIYNSVAIALSDVDFVLFLMSGGDLILVCPVACSVDF